MNKDIIYFEDQHGLVFNMRQVKFDENIMISVIENYDGSLETKREILQSLLISQYHSHEILIHKTNYGDLDVNFSLEVKEIEKYILKIMDRLSSNLTNEEFETFGNILNNVCNFNSEEITKAELIRNDLKKMLSVEV